MRMARATTIQALRNRGLSKKTAVILADAGFTLEKLAASKVERLTKFLPKKEAEKVLKKLGAAPAEVKAAPKKEKAKPAARGRKPAAKAAEAEPETPLTILPIAELVDRLMADRTIRHEGSTEWCDLPAGTHLEVPSLSEKGRIVWREVRSVSRHGFRAPLLRLRTRSGREIVATPNHSFVTRRGGRIVPVRGATLRVGDRIPVVRRWSLPNEMLELDMSEVLPRDRYWYGSEVAKPRALGPEWRRGFARDC